MAPTLPSQETTSLPGRARIQASTVAAFWSRSRSTTLRRFWDRPRNVPDFRGFSADASSKPPYFTGFSHVALSSGGRGREFESRHSDHMNKGPEGPFVVFASTNIWDASQISRRSRYSADALAAFFLEILPCSSLDLKATSHSHRPKPPAALTAVTCSFGAFRVTSFCGLSACRTRHLDDQEPLRGGAQRSAEKTEEQGLRIVG